MTGAHPLTTTTTRVPRSNGMKLLSLAAISLLCLSALPLVRADCLSNPVLESDFRGFLGVNHVTSLPTEGSCCQKDICNIPCPAEEDPPPNGFLIAVALSITMSGAIGLASLYLVRGKNVNFFVAGRTLPLSVIALTLSASSIDSNALLGNADLAYKFQFWDGAVLPIGLALSLFLNGMFLARHIRREETLTLPEIYGRYYGTIVEVIVSLITIVSFIALLAGNLVGMAKIITFVSPQISFQGAVFLSGAIILIYTVTGGFFAIASTDVFQMAIGLSGILVTAYYLIANSPLAAAPPSIGAPGYVYPDAATCKMYEGMPCSVDTSQCCYNTPKWCPNPNYGASGCRTDNFAYPFGDAPIIYAEMGDPNALGPFPNAIYYNWATIIILGFGNLAALDFQSRCMASRTEHIATAGSFIAAAVTMFVGIPFSYLGGITRAYYGPDSPYAEFAADTCHRALDLPTCAMWVPDDYGFLKLLANAAITPRFIGGWCLVAIVAASMSTSSGAILATSTVAAHNIARKIPRLGVSEKNLLLVARVFGIPVTLCACCIAAFSNRSSTGYLLVVAFDIMFAGCIVPLFACFYVKDASPSAALVSVVGGSLLRVILEGTLPKDGFLILPYPGDYFLNYGAASSSLLPGFLDVPAADKWDRSSCEQERLRDFTGVDSIASPILCLILFFTVHYGEKFFGKKLFTHRLLAPIPKPLYYDASKSDMKPTKLDLAELSTD
ncbi:Sodium:solute symporter family-domain-containing protein, partial [Pavlovales sp. CCMP2436]